jgi:hypothetical protein
MKTRGKSIDDLIVEREAEQGYQRGLLNLEQTPSVKASLKQSRQRATALGTAIRKINEKSNE